MTVFFTSDTHFGHKNIINYCNRPYRTVEGMDKHMIYLWNRVVKEGDTVYHLGDLSFLSREETKAIVNKLNGKLILIYGNHDKDRWKSFLSYETEATIVIEGQKIILSHHPKHVWEDMDKGAWHLHGHSHASGIFHMAEEAKYGTKRMDVGVDMHRFRPISFEQIRSWFDKVDKVIKLERIKNGV